jgi:queuine/archaeosine tRNA-ribosyltransferase
MRLLTEHNLAFLAGVMGEMRAAIAGGRLAAVADSLRRGEFRPNPSVC